MFNYEVALVSPFLKSSFLLLFYLLPLTSFSTSNVFLQSHFSYVQLFAALCQAPLSMGFSRQEYWGGS